MPESTLPFRQRLVGKMALFGVIPTLLLVGLIVGINIRRETAQAQAEAERTVTEGTRRVVSELEAQSSHAEVIASLLARVQSEGGLFGHRAETARLLRAVVADHPEIRSAAVIYEPNADGNDAQELMESVVAGSSPPTGLGRFAIEARRGDGSKAEDGEPVINLDSPAEGWVDGYAEVRRHAERNARAELSMNIAVSTDGAVNVHQVTPLMRDGRFVGVVQVELALEELQAAMSRAGERAAADLFLSDGVHVLATTGAVASEEGRKESAVPVAGHPLERALRVFLDTPGAVRVQTALDPVTGVESHYGITRLRHGNWSLVVRMPTAGIGESMTAALVRNVVTATCGVAAIAIVLITLARGVGRRLERAVHAARRIADGNLAEPVPPSETADESGLLLDAFEQMTLNLNRIVGQVQHASIQINSTATELAATSRELETTATGFGASATEVAAATRQISTTGEELLHTMQAVADSAAGAAEKAQDSRNGLRSMQTSVRRLDDAAHSVAARLSAINEKAKGINAIVATITKVADETNLLSVNASIEAEKAGEFGLGFLIVAREIRRLADQTASATLDIERMIRQMQSAVSAGVSEMDRFGDSLRTVLDDVDRVGNRVQGIIAHVEDDTIRFVQVTEGMRSQAAGAKQIDEAMRELSVGARQTIQSAGEFGNAANDLERAIASLKVTVSSMRLRDANALARGDGER